MQIFVLIKLKFIINRNNLSKICVPYILPLLAYACELWDERCSRNIDKLNQLQLEAARRITGLPKFASKVCIDLKFGSNEFHKRIADGTNELENISKQYLGTLYCKEFLRL
jgi:hypothetical protein